MVKFALFTFRSVRVSVVDVFQRIIIRFSKKEREEYYGSESYDIIITNEKERE